MEKNPPPLVGFNNNVRHRGQVFHIQTEDSGVKHARIMTHLFADGGRIVQTARSEYAEHLGREDMTQVVRQLMKEQHKAMFVSLRAGALDEQIERACGPLPLPPPVRPPAPVATLTPLAEPPVGSPPAASTVEPEAVEPAAATAQPTEAQPRPRSWSNPGLRRVVPSVAPPPGAELDFEVEKLQDAPRDPGDPRRAVALAKPRPAAEAAGQRPDEEARYAHSRLATIFGEMPLPGASIFGEQMSEKSLDEVILSYIAEDLDE